MSSESHKQWTGRPAFPSPFTGIQILGIASIGKADNAPPAAKKHLKRLCDAFAQMCMASQLNLGNQSKA